MSTTEGNAMSRSIRQELILVFREDTKLLFPSFALNKNDLRRLVERLTA